MMTHKLGRLCACTGLMALSSSAAFGQWQEQSFSLQAGWNTAFIEVDPADNSADVVFVTAPAHVITAVWTWQPTLAGVGIACPDPTAPECQPSTASGWRLWLPPSDPNATLLNTLYAVRGGHVYVIVTSAPATLTIKGKPSTSKTRWLTDFNIAGFHVDASSAPSFETYLAPSTAHADSRVFEMDATGDLSEITDLSTAIVPIARLLGVVRHEHGV